MSVTAIGAGLGRTGTCLSSELEQLGLGPRHHRDEAMAHSGRIPTWHTAGRGENVDWGKLLAGYRSTVDWPSAQFWGDLAEKFPDARIVLTVRDTERWHESFSKTILQLLGVCDHPDPTIGAILAMTRDVIVNRAFGGRLDDPDHIKACFERHNAAVEAAAPPGRLLVFEVAQGWAPLCAFLGVPVPTTPFPRVNSTREFWESIEKGGASTFPGSTNEAH